MARESDYNEIFRPYGFLQCEKLLADGCLWVLKAEFKTRTVTPVHSPVCRSLEPSSSPKSSASLAA